ncbi:MAG: DUF971 domain-containing protein [Armatimonadota bacterium]|nr:DUF971 domain-containing protein [Armatimonadota bacterium]
MSPRMPTPVEMGSVTEKMLQITWSDGHRSTYTWMNLRLRCPCAACVGEWRYRPPALTPQDIRPDIRAMSVSRVGAYALRFEWSDGHNTGLYTFASLRNDLCECPECTARRALSTGT